MGFGKGQLSEADNNVTEPATIPPNNRRATDRTLPFIFLFLLSILVIAGGFIYLHFSRPDQVTSAAILAAIAAVITFWFVKLPREYNGNGDE